jgi:phage terminase large subunit GpA-like protein
VLGLFNLGDRNRFYWRCPHCEGLFLAEWQNLSWDKELTNPAAAGQTAHIICTHCGKPIGAEYKDRMNQSGVWRSEYEVFGGEPSDSGIASYWLNGVAASMETWARLVQSNMTAMADYERTGSQEKLKAFVNTSLGMAYKVRRKKGDALDSVLLQQRSEEYGAQRKVPPQARFVTTAVDVQKHRFVVQVQAWGAKGETWIVDRFNIVPSDRIGDDGQKIKVSPFTHPEDWSVLDRLLDDEYPVVGCEVKVKSRLVVCDSGGFGESTANAYAYATRLKRLSKVERFALLKGASTRTAQRISAGKPGDDRIKVPLWVINTTMLKDETWAALGREEAGENYIHLPTWLGEWFFKELTAEEKQANGSWIKRRHGDNNEAFDLCGYNRAAYGILGGEKINWESPPTWCATPVGEQAPEAVKSSKDGNGKFNEWLRARGQRVNGE